MLSKLVEFALTQRLLVAAMTLLLIGAGIASFRDLPIDAFPDVSSTQVKLIMKAPGMTPEEVEARIVTPIELEMLGIPNQRIMRSISKYAIADITIDFNEGTDIYWARQQVAERLNNAQRDLPASASGGLAPITTPLGEMFMFTVEGDGVSLEDRRTILDWIIRPALRTLPGVADVNSLGGLARSFEVVPDHNALASHGISFAMLQQAIQANNRNDGAGRINDGDEALLVRAEGSVKNLQDVRNIVIASPAGNPIRVGDVAQVRIGSMTRYGVVTKDGRGEAVEGLVLGLRGANAQKVVAGVQAKLLELAPTLPKGVTTKVFYDRGSLVNRAIGTVSKALTEAIVLVVILLVLFLGNLRAAVVVAITLPLAVLITFILMQQFGMSANLMSLGGLAIAIGMLVDGSVVVMENIINHLAGRRAHIPHLHVIYRAVKEVITPVAAGVAIIIIVFLPLMTLQGLEGKLFIPVALTIVFALAGSLILSLTVVPMLSSLLIKTASHDEPWLVRKAMAIYTPLLEKALKKERVVIASALLVLAISGGVYTLIGKAFMPEMDEGDLIMQVSKLPSINIAQTAAMDERIQRAILDAVPEVKGIVSRAGADELGLDPMGLNETDNFLVLKPQAEWRNPDKNAIVDHVRSVMSDFPGVEYSFTQPIAMRVSEMLTGARGDIAIKIFGTDLNKLNEAAEHMVKVLQGIRGSEDVFTVKNSGVQYFRVVIDRLAAGRLGLSVDDIGNALRSQIEGQNLGTVIENGRRTPLIMRGEIDIQQSPALFAALTLPLPNGHSVPLSVVAKLERVDGPVKVDRENGMRMVVVQSNVRDRDLVGFVEEAKSAVADQIKLPQGYRLTWGGQFENQQRAAARLAVVVPVALGMIFMLLFATFGSVKQAVLVLTNIPFALIGGIFALWISGEYMSVPASVGFIALLGIAVLNGVVMVSYFNQLVAQGMDITQVVFEGAKRRLRPVLMTASITAFGLLPVLFATGPGSEIQKPLAIVVTGGLISSTLLTLIMLPILYRRFGLDSARKSK
ncbi:efflux RND transporter permease subunit [Gallionella capsiferriformans]|uniref:Heavy metal efflux pump, CzcA family n=1 Tax=Gallionella capsiferriformans (strain ES-2) TaxID=395494 RepID=D9SF94_GALCS|nr:CusA/CzcA family heavy metal efflux RND transporter [Gallionella capsiferriformans]ADL55191.1 heavy metal efflux pump, CzcA family [Gallionella capsiferriformans ES-2]